jgi:hypothetical protein
MNAVPLAFLAKREKVPVNTARFAAEKGKLKAWKQGRDWFTTENYFNAWNSSPDKTIRRKSRQK